MAESSGARAPLARWDVAFKEVDQWLISSFSGVVRLGTEAPRFYPKRRVKAGWRVPVDFEGRTRRFDILLDIGFPFNPPRLALVDPPRHLTWPHLESDGYLCLLPGSATAVSNDPIAVLTHLLKEAVDWLEASESGANMDDFRAEFSSYWTPDPGAPLVRSLLNTEGPSRPIVCHQRTAIHIVADSTEALSRWLDHVLKSSTDIRGVFHAALIIWLEQPLLPSEYPACTTDAIRLVRSVGLGEELDRIAARQQERITIIIGAPTANGPALAAIVLQLGSANQSRGGPHRSFGGVERGFRPGHMPPGLLAQRHLSSVRLSKARVERVDAAWIHGRDGDPDLPRLRTAKVVVVGCGSLGGLVALGLAQTGVGTLDLIDPEMLEASNVGRHALGASEIGAAKAEAVASRIRADYPHILGIQGFLARWEDVSSDQPDVFEGTDLIISTIGHWSSEGALNAWRYDRGAAPDLIFGWMEPHGVAGHVVGLFGGSGCLQCGLSDWGEPLLSVADWPNGAGLRGEPACGVMFQPYGSVEVSHVVALITEAAIDVLLGRLTKSFHRVWSAREDIFMRAGGVWSAAWKAAYGAQPSAARMVERDWPTRPDCPSCGRAAR